MEEKRLYDIDSEELTELIDGARVKLQNNNEKYKELMKQIYKIKDKYPTLRALFENDKVSNLDEKECNMLQKIIQLYLEISTFEDREIFFLGARENYFYLKNLNLIKEN